jgi:hypothetical protein
MSWHFHDWTLWSKPFTSILSCWVGGVSGGIKKEYEAQIQDRTCHKCGKYRWRQL